MAYETELLTADHPPFRPFATLTGAHQQTFAAFLAQGKMSDYRAVRHIVPLADGDRLVIHDDEPNTWITGDRIAILLHGLCGSHESPYMRRTSDKLRRNGVRTIRVDLRGFGTSTLISRSHVYAGCSQDARDVVEFIRRMSPLSKISLIGFSLGANIILKTLGEWNHDFPRCVDSAIVVQPPVDLEMGCVNLTLNGNRVYDQYFMRKLRSHLAFRRRHVKDLVDNGLSPVPNQLLHFDDRFTGPIWGFRGARDYYQQSSSGPFMKYVQVPTILVAAKDDPIVPFEMFRNFEMSNYIERVTTKHGGHLGFIGRHPGDPDRFWLDWRICHWISRIDED